MARESLQYVLITPARNEEDLIEGTIQSMVAQTRLPRKWLIVSDGSTDGTDAIVSRYTEKYPWIELLKRPVRKTRDFGGKARCFNAGFEHIQSLAFDIVGNLDADLTFAPNTMAFLIERFEENPRLGVAGAPFVEKGVSYDYRFTNIEHVSGACQIFRRQCFAEIGGYVPVESGGIDWIAVTTARMKGWQTRTFVEVPCDHHRPMGTALVGSTRAFISLGRQEYYLGGHPVWQMVRALFQATRRPFVVGGFCLWWGYFRAWAGGAKVAVSDELKRFHRGEQMRRLRQRIWPFGRNAKEASG